MKKKEGILSAVLLLIFVFPTCAQSFLPPPKNGNVYVIAHRGAHDGIPENSLAAYQKAIDLGCDFVEIDVRTTKDNQLVSVHNSTIDGYVPSNTGKIREMTLEELKKIDIGKRIGKEWENTQIPTLDEILSLCRGKIDIYLDLKDADPEQIIQHIRKHNMEGHIAWYIPASRHKTLMEVKQFCEECLIMPDPGALENIERVAIAYQPKIIASDMGHLSKSFVQKAHDHAAMVFVDDKEDNPAMWEAEWGKIINWGTDGIQTDQPQALINYLKRNK